jgi:hypothetical protein
VSAHGHERITEKDVGELRRAMFPPMHEEWVPWYPNLSRSLTVDHCDICPLKQSEEPCNIACSTQQNVKVE